MADEHLEDRLTYLLQPGCPIGMKGWKEALPTKVLCPLPAYLANLKYSYERSDAHHTQAV